MKKFFVISLTILLMWGQVTTVHASNPDKYVKWIIVGVVGTTVIVDIFQRSTRQWVRHRVGIDKMDGKELERVQDYIAKLAGK